MKPIGERIKELRKSKGISQVVMAEACGIKQSSYANIENGKTQTISIEVGKGIAKALNMPFGELFEVEAAGANAVELEKKVKELEEKISALENRIKEKDKIIELIEKENNLLVKEGTMLTLFSVVNMLIEDEINMNNAKTEDIKKMYEDMHSKMESDTKNYINENIEEGILTKENVVEMFVDNEIFLELLKENTNSDAEFYENISKYITKYMPVTNKEIEYFMLKKKKFSRGKNLGSFKFHK